MVGAAAPPEAPPDDGPYVGLTPFTEADAEFFFGRERERRIVTTNLLASRLTLVYGPTGVGKSSLLRAGVERQLRVAAAEAVADGRMPESIGVVFRNWRDAPLPAVAERLEETIAGTLGELAPEPPARDQRLDLLLADWTYRLSARTAELAGDARQPPRTDLLLILDQFEEYFLYHPDEAGDGTFACEFPRAVNVRGLHANFVVAIREDAYTLLDRFEG